MAKIISDKYASKDDPIFTGRYTISNPKVFTKKPIKVNKENLKETNPFFDGVRQLKRNRWGALNYEQLLDIQKRSTKSNNRDEQSVKSFGTDSKY